LAYILASNNKMQLVSEIVERRRVTQPLIGDEKYIGGFCHKDIAWRINSRSAKPSISLERYFGRRLPVNMRFVA
jgi:hypothetical protein